MYGNCHLFMTRIFFVALAFKMLVVIYYFFDIGLFFFKHTSYVTVTANVGIYSTIYSIQINVDNIVIVKSKIICFQYYKVKL